MSTKPLIPSKDALRVLRSLAHAPSAAVIGTASALCGVAAVHYHERQRLRTAQRIVETKRKLHTITKGRGSARLALMFEAAERGEDFTIRGCRRQRPLGRRKYSVAPAQSPADSDADWKPFSESDEGTTADVTGNVGQKHAISHHTRSSSAKLSLNFGHKPLIRKPRRSDDTADLNEIYKQSSLQDNRRGRYSHLTWTEKMNETKDSIVHTPNHVKHALAKRSGKTEELMETSTESDKWKLLGSQPTSPILQPVTDLSPVETNLIVISSHQSASPAKQDLNMSILLNTNMSESLAFNGLSSLQPWHTVADSTDSEKMKNVIGPQSQHTLEDLDLYFPSSANIPTLEPRHESRSRYNLSNTRVRQGMSLVGADRYLYLFTSLMNCRQQHGTRASLVLLEQIMNRYTSTRKRSDFALVQALYLDCTRLFSTSDLKSVAYRYVERFLHGDTPRLEVVSVLYPRCGAGAPSGKHHYYFLAHQYLETLNERGYGLDEQIVELRKVLAGTRMLGIQSHEHLVLPVLRSLCSAGRMTAAQALFDEATTVYEVNATFYSLQVLVRGYAKASNWSKVKAILDHCHAMNLSRQSVYGTSGLLASIIQDYAGTQSPERVVEFMMYCIREYGIQPVSGITGQIICLCLRHRRYDLVADWISMVRTDFPHIETGTRSSTFAFDIGRVWKDIDASCDDILDGCKAIANRSLRDPFSKTFRSSVSEAVSQYIEPKLQELRASLGTDVPGRLIGEVDDFFMAISQLKKHKAVDVKAPRTKLLLNHLLSQSQTLCWLNALLRGQMQAEKHTDPALQVEKDEFVREEKPLPLAAFASLRDTMMQEYEERYSTGQSIEHEKLRRIATKLVQQNRAPHAFDLIQTVYDSRWAQPPIGREFDIEVFTDWLKLASDIKSGSKVRSVLWAILDAGPQLKLSSHVILLARIAAPKTHLRKAKVARDFEVDEVEYLRLRLRRRFWSASSGKSTLKFGDWQGFGRLHGQYEVD